MSEYDYDDEERDEDFDDEEYGEDDDGDFDIVPHGQECDHCDNPATRAVNDHYHCDDH